MSASRDDLTPFCSYCGYPPLGRGRSPSHRVCSRCEMGAVLSAPAGSQPRFYEPFVIVDPALRLQAVSRRAEALLMVDEPAAVEVPLSEFLLCRTDQDQMELSGLVRHAVGGTRLAARVALRTVADPAMDVVTRVAGCGPPPAALLILTPLRTPGARWSERTPRSASAAQVEP
jgi:hypothetical protein